MLETLGLSTVVVAAAEIGDKTQLLSIFLAARYRAPKPIIWGILLATIFNHALAGALGASLSSLISYEVLRWVLIVSFLAMAVWILIPDKMEDDDFKKKAQRFGVFGTTFVLFFLAEMGDKTQIATIAMSARYASEAVWVIMGTTLGMMIANVPAVYLGEKIAEKISMVWMRRIAAAVFVTLAVLTYFG